MNKLMQKVTSHAFLRRVAVLASGSIAGQAVLVLAAPILTRLYTPTDFGVLAVFMSTLAIGAMLMSLRYELALHLPQENADALRLLQAGIFMAAGSSFVLGAALFFMPVTVLQRFGLEVLQPYAWMVALGLWGLTLYTLFTNYATRFKAEKTLAKTKFSQAIAGSILQIALYTFGLLGLLFGQIITQSGGIFKLWRHASTQNNWPTFNWKTTRTLLWRYKKFPLIAAPTSFVNRVGLHAAPFFLTALYAPSVAGLFLLGNKLVGMPMVLVGRSLAQVFFAELAHRNRKGKTDSYTFYLKTLLLLLGGSLPFFVVLYPLAPWAFGLVLGESWREAGVYVQILIPMFWLQFAVSPLSQTLNILEKQGTQAVWDTLRFCIVLMVFTLAGKEQWSILETLFWYNFGMSVCYVTHPFLCVYYLKKGAKQHG